MNLSKSIVIGALILGMGAQAQESEEPYVARYEVIGRITTSNPPVPGVLLLSFTEKIMGTTEPGEFRSGPGINVIIAEWLIHDSTYEWRIGPVANSGRLVWVTCLPGVRNEPAVLRFPPGAYRSLLGIKNTQDLRIHFGPLWQSGYLSVNGIPLDKQLINGILPVRR